MLTSVPNDMIVFHIIDLDINFSDHCPVFAVIKQNIVHNLDKSQQPESLLLVILDGKMLLSWIIMSTFAYYWNQSWLI
jgi:hypothetical protein